MKIHKREYNHTLLTQEDRVIASAPIAMEGGMFLGAHGEVQMVSGNDVNIANAVMVMARGVVVLNTDMTSSTRDVDELWDALVPKDEAHSSTASVNQVDTSIEEGEETTTTFNEPGLPNMSELGQSQGIWGERVFDYEEILTFAKTSDGFKDATPDTFRANTIFPIMAERNVRMVDLPGYALFALGNPAMTATTTVVQATLRTGELLMHRHLTRLIEDAWKQFVGLDEAGAESPFVNIATLIVDLTEPSIHEETAGAWTTQSFNAWSTMNIYTSVPGSDIVPSTLSAD